MRTNKIFSILIAFSSFTISASTLTRKEEPDTIYKAENLSNFIISETTKGVKVSALKADSTKILLDFPFKENGVVKTTKNFYNLKYDDFKDDDSEFEVNLF